jgi:hypothetical protein
VQLPRLRHQILLAMGLPACWAGSSRDSATPPPPPPTDRATIVEPHRTQTVAVADPSQWQANPAFGAQRGCTPETVCGRSDTRHGPTGCGPHGDSLESFGGNYQRLSVTRMSWTPNPGELRLFDLDPAETAQYQRTVTVSSGIDRYCCYSHCTPSRPPAQLPVAPPGMQLAVSCRPAPLQFADPHADNPECPATEGRNPYVSGTDAQCCYGSFEPIPPPPDQNYRHPRGRAARVDGESVVAPVRGGSTWRIGDMQPHVDGIAAATRAALRDAWLAAAQMEHASIAAFSALSLRLIASGAPSDLLVRTHAAALDEIRHAELAFALASAYADAPLEPARFDDVARMKTTGSLAALARETFVDGCIDETAAAVDASLAATTAHDPVVADALRAIAEDEGRHAELAWAIVAWCVRTEPAIADDLRAVLTEQLAEQGALAVTSHELAGHGIRSASESARTRANVLREVVEPCFGALLAASA